jgi:hypothetical protein
VIVEIIVIAVLLCSGSQLFCRMMSLVCDLVVKVPGYRSREIVCLERGPLSLMRVTVELLEWKSSGSGSRKPRLTAVGIRCTDHATPSSVRKSWH